MEIRKGYVELGELENRHTVCIDVDEPCGDHDQPVYLFTEDELKDFVRDIYKSASSSVKWQSNFELYWQQKFGGK